ncbi:MAG TPA: hypothetical protein VG754_13060 [Verrucomicrobiae bacterium]|jgi:hypothetical protein|nr:hypothetical protein [Verrucomicrobiae bacterium]
MKNNNNKLKGSVSEACAKYCQKILSQVAKTKNAVLAQFRDLVADNEQLLQLALNEAEALAWQTRYPQLVFQDLAEEKAKDVVSWVAHQREVRSGINFRN